MKEAAKWSQPRHAALVFAIVACFVLLAAGQGVTAGNETREPKKVSALPPSSAIPVAEVATRATEVSNLLHTLETQLASSPAIETIRKQLPKVSAHIDLLLEGTTEILQEQPPWRPSRRSNRYGRGCRSRRPAG